ncbi:hypothetical protein B0O80DRAFT_208143 [Mortierella sp. GBAus27b]|nr:hypothetical protein B0O80DRAFT_208143 [Mortierella sp. GBAus27b]
MVVRDNERAELPDQYHTRTRGIRHVAIYHSQRTRVVRSGWRVIDGVPLFFPIRLLCIS